MLVALVPADWPKDKQKTIFNRRKALSKEIGEPIGKVANIGSLGDGEPLWLFSHGSATTFGGMTEKELAGFLLKTVKMPRGARRIVLKGCRTGDYATRVEVLINGVEGYEKVEVVGFEGEASQTTSDGRMLVRIGTEAEKRKAGRVSALEEIRMRREAAESGVSKAEVDKQVAATKDQVERHARTYGATYDEGSRKYVAEDDRMRRRMSRAEKSTTTTTPVPQQTGSDSDERMDVDEDTSMQTS